MQTPELVSTREAAKRLGVCPQTLRLAIRRENVPVWTHPLNTSVRLIRTADLEALRSPRQMTSKSPTEASAA